MDFGRRTARFRAEVDDTSVELQAANLPERVGGIQGARLFGNQPSGDGLFYGDRVHGSAGLSCPLPLYRRGEGIHLSPRQICLPDAPLRFSSLFSLLSSLCVSHLPVARCVSHRSPLPGQPPHRMSRLALLELQRVGIHEPAFDKAVRPRH